MKRVAVICFVLLFACVLAGCEDPNSSKHSWFDEFPAFSGSSTYTNMELVFDKINANSYINELLKENFSKVSGKYTKTIGNDKYEWTYTGLSGDITAIWEHTNPSGGTMDAYNVFAHFPATSGKFTRFEMGRIYIANIAAIQAYDNQLRIKNFNYDSINMRYVKQISDGSHYYFEAIEDTTQPGRYKMIWTIE